MEIFLYEGKKFFFLCMAHHFMIQTPEAFAEAWRSRCFVLPAKGAEQSSSAKA